MYSDQYEILNDSSKTKFIWIEPWALDIKILPNSSCIIYSDSEFKGKFEIEKEGDSVTIYCWEGAGLIIKINEEEIWNFNDNRVPVMSNGMSTKNFIDLVFKANQK